MDIDDDEEEEVRLVERLVAGVATGVRGVGDHVAGSSPSMWPPPPPLLPPVLEPGRAPDWPSVSVPMLVEASETQVAREEQRSEYALDRAEQVVTPLNAE